MMNQRIHIVAFVLAVMLFSAPLCLAQPELSEKRIHVAMRMIGHQILLQSGDSSSLVLPIEKDSGRYRIQFEDAFQFSPEILVATIDSVVKQAGIASSYRVEVEACESRQVVYSYEIGNSVKNDLVPCINRMLPQACYQIYVTLLDSQHPMSSYFAAAAQPGKRAPLETTAVSYYWVALAATGLVLTIVLLFYFLRKKRQVPPDSHIVSVGAYQFNKRSMELCFKNHLTELSSKEADLLNLLLNASNSTVERDYLLKTVWGDEGSYIGRTLDVFISKLRKKLESDANVKIVNVRGVGYKLVLKG